METRKKESGEGVRSDEGVSKKPLPPAKTKKPSEVCAVEACSARTALLRSSFCLLGGLSVDAEKMLWSKNVLTWNDYRQTDEILSDSKRHKRVLADLEKAETALAEENWTWFLKRLPTGERTRLFPCLKEQTWFLDIETTGLCSDYDKITTVALYDGSAGKVFVQGKDLEEVPKQLEQKSLLVTFNGTTFDLRFLRNTLDWNGTCLHVDLRYEFRAHGYTGGLKSIERQLGLAGRQSGVEDGLEAVRLWYRYVNGSQQALERLMAYNMEDTEVLKKLTLHLLRQSFSAHPMGSDLVRRAFL